MNELRVALRRSARKKADDENDDENDDDEKSTPFAHRRRCNRRFGTDMDEWLEKARKGGDGWRTRENVVDGLLPFLAAEYETAKREALVFSSRKEFEDTEEEEEEEEGAQKNALLRKISNAKLKAMYDEFFDVYGDLLAMNDVKRDKEMFLEWLESKVCSASEGRSTRVGRETIPSLHLNAVFGSEKETTKKDDVQSYLRKRNESLRKFRVMKSRALYECCDDERSVSTRSKFLAIVLEGFRHATNENLLHDTFFPRDPPSSLAPSQKSKQRELDQEEKEKEEEPLCFNNKIYLTLRAFCSEPTNAAVVERCYKSEHVKSPCARRILRLCAEGCFDSEKYEYIASARKCNDHTLRTMGDAVTKCKIVHGKEYVCVRWMCRSKFEVNDVARKAFQDVYAEVTALEILRDCDKKISVIEDDISVSYSFGTLRDYGACEDFLCVATDWVDGIGLNNWRSNLRENGKKDGDEVNNNDGKLLLSFAKTMLHMIVDMHEKDVVHFDLKPEHFILSTRREEEGTKYAITLIDFGECAVYDGSDKVKGTSRARGTEIYHAPEMLLIDETKIRRTLLEPHNDEDDNSNAAVVDGKKCDCYALGVALCELFFNNSPNRHAYEESGFLGMLNTVAGDENAYSKMLRDDILAPNASSLQRRPLFEENVANWLLQTLLVRDPRKRASARDALEMFSEVMRNNNKWCHGM